MTTCTGVSRVNAGPEWKVPSDTRSSKSSRGRLSRHDLICLQWYFCIAILSKHRCSSERSSEGAIPMCGASRRPVDRPAVREVVSNRTEQMMETAGPLNTPWSSPAIMLLPDGRNAGAAFSPPSHTYYPKKNSPFRSTCVCAIRKRTKGEKSCRIRMLIFAAS